MRSETEAEEEDKKKEEEDVINSQTQNIPHDAVAANSWRRSQVGGRRGGGGGYTYIQTHTNSIR